MMSTWRYSLIIWFVASLPLVAQTKLEKEYRMSKEAVPLPALRFVDDLAQERKVKWYKEQGLERSTIEAKFKRNKRRYSVEFNNSGLLEDVEIERSYRSLPDTLKTALDLFFEAQYKRHRICKTQIQYSGKPEKVLAFLQQSGVTAMPRVVTRFEIVAKVKSDKTSREVEFLFDLSGRLLSKAVIIQKNADHLEY